MLVTRRVVRPGAELETVVVQITRVGDDVTDAQVDGVVELQRVVEADVDPERPPVTPAEVAGMLRHQLPAHRYWTWLARDGDATIGRVSALMDLRPTNTGLVEVEEVMVHPERRRRGIATAVMRAAVTDLAASGASSLIIWPQDDAGRQFCERIGLTRRQDERQSRLRVDEVDDAQQEEWMAAPKGRAAGYSVVSWAGSTPGEHLDAWLVACDAMADAPLDSIEWTHDPPTAEWMRATEAVYEARGTHRYASLALAADGSAGGMTLIVVPSSCPRRADQYDTAVVPAHRGHGLGRWLKAANLAQVRRAHPELEMVDTWNAETNGPMLDINVAMGFRPLRTWYAYQASVATVADRVAGRVGL